jgi:hypothetical protein
MNIAELRRHLRATMTAAGFHRRGTAFHRMVGDNWATIVPNASSKTCQERLVVAIEMGVTSGSFARLEGRVVDPPSADLDYARRLSSGDGDWWAIDAGDTESLARLERAIREKAIPEITRLAESEQLREALLVEKSNHGLSPRCLQCLIAITADFGPRAELRGLLEESRRMLAA